MSKNMDISLDIYFLSDQKTCKPYSLVGPTCENLALHPLAVLSLNNWLFVIFS